MVKDGVCDKIVRERFCVTRWCVTKMVCDKDGVSKMMCDKDGV